MTSMVLSLLLLATLSSTFINASPIDKTRHKRDLMIEMDENDLRNMLAGGDFIDEDITSQLIKRRKRDLMIADDDNGDDLGRWLLDHYNGMSSVDELPIGKRSAFAETKHPQQKKSGPQRIRNKIYVWFPDDTKHARKPTKVQQPSRLPFRVPDTFKFARN